MSGKRRVYEVARELDMDNKALLAVLKSLDVPDVKNHMSVLSSEDEARVSRHLGKGGVGTSNSSDDAKQPTDGPVQRRAVVRRRKGADGAPEETSARRDLSGDSEERLDSAPENPRQSDDGRDDGPAEHPSVVSRGVAVRRAPAVQNTPASAHSEPSNEASRVAASADHGAPASDQASAAQQSSTHETTSGDATSNASAHSTASHQGDHQGAEERSAGESSSSATSHAQADQFAQVFEEETSKSATPSVAKASRDDESSRESDESKDVPASEQVFNEEIPAASSQGAPRAAQGSMISPRPSSVTSGSVSPARSSAPSASAAGAGSTSPSSAPSESASPSVPPGAQRPSTPPKRGIDVWEGRPGVPMHNHRPGPRRVQYDAKAPAPVGAGGAPGGGAGARRGPGGRMMRGGPRQRGIGSFSRGRGGGPVTKERNAHKKVVRIEETVTLQTLAGNMGVKTGDMLRQLFALGMSGININSTLDADTAKIIASEFGWEVEDVAVSEAEQLQKAQGTDVESDNPEDLKPRPPVVTVMGHVDHGKTSLLDAMRHTNIVSGESGGITQHIGAYSVDTPSGKVTFLDTPGHAAFTQMRARGAKATDLVVLVVAADDGVMPQTKEAIQHARSAGVPIVVAINKCDKPEAQPERVRREVSETGLVPEEWGGDTLFCEVSAHTKQGIPELLEKLALQAEVMDLRANPDKPASGMVVESQLDRGRGPVATILVKEGTLRTGDVVLAGAAYGKIRAMQDWAGVNHKEAGPSEPVSIIGLSEVPRAGDQVYVVKDLKTAQGIAETRKVKERRSLAPSVGNKPRTLDEIALLMSETEQLELKVIVKADVGGSAEAVSESLVGLSTEKVKVSVVLQAAGAITENDVNLAVAAGAIILGFNVKPAGKAAMVAQREGIEIRHYTIIYNVLDDVKLAMEGMLAPKLVERPLGAAQVRQTFRITKAGTIAGCMVTSGLVRRNAGARLVRAGEKVWEGKISGLKRFKEDVKEVKEGFECGISLEDMGTIHVDDVIEVFEMESVKQSL